MTQLPPTQFGNEVLTISQLDLEMMSCEQMVNKLVRDDSNVPAVVRLLTHLSFGDKELSGMLI